MSAAYHRFYNGATVAVTKTALTNPEIAKNTPHGNPASEGGVISKFGGSKVNNGTSTTSGQ